MDPIKVIELAFNAAIEAKNEEFISQVKGFMLPEGMRNKDCMQITLRNGNIYEIHVKRTTHNAAAT